MTIATKEEYEQKKNDLMNNGGMFMGMYSHFINMPCAIYDSNSKGVTPTKEKNETKQQSFYLW